MISVEEQTGTHCHLGSKIAQQEWSDWSTHPVRFQHETCIGIQPIDCMRTRECTSAHIDYGVSRPCTGLFYKYHKDDKKEAMSDNNIHASSTVKGEKRFNFDNAANALKNYLDCEIFSHIHYFCINSLCPDFIPSDFIFWLNWEVSFQSGEPTLINRVNSSNIIKNPNKWFDWSNGNIEAVSNEQTCIMVHSGKLQKTECSSYDVTDLLCETV